MKSEENEDREGRRRDSEGNAQGDDNDNTRQGDEEEAVGEPDDEQTGYAAEQEVVGKKVAEVCQQCPATTTAATRGNGDGTCNARQ